MPFTTLLAQEAPPWVAPNFALVAVGAAILLALVFLIWAILNPNVARMFARIFAVGCTKESGGKRQPLTTAQNRGEGRPNYSALNK